VGRCAFILEVVLPVFAVGRADRLNANRKFAKLRNTRGDGLVAIQHVEQGRNHELAAFLRSRRARLAPEQVGLPHGIRRHTPGLRRDEVALLAGITPEWYTRLEQGRDIRVSVQLLESLARVLKLNATERTYLFLLALRQPPPVTVYSPTSISPTLAQFLTQLGTTPACIVDARLNIVDWNAAYSAALGVSIDSATPRSERDRNVIWRIFTSPVFDHADTVWQELARICLAYFRKEYGRFVDDPWWADQIAALHQISPEFRNLWADHELSGHTEAHKSMQHPRIGELSFDLLLLQAIDSSDLRVLLFTPRNGSGTAEKIERLLALHD
jgi:transcriptional regulator with XRE-family HTH domain